jgi:hypothetical protein
MDEVLYKDDNGKVLDGEFEWSFFASFEYEKKHLANPIERETGRIVKFEPSGWCYELIATTYRNRLVSSPASIGRTPTIWKLDEVATRQDVKKIYHCMNLSASDDF